MNREIKFRIWNKETKQMFQPHAISQELIDDRPDLEIMQFTGLKDENGKEIYEGDIISPHNHIVKFKNGVFGTVSEDNVYHGYLHEDIGEVIGNIYEQ